MESSIARAAVDAAHGESSLLDAGLLLLRVAVGGAFVRHGARWLLGPGIAAMAPAFGRQGVPWAIADATAVVFIACELLFGFAMMLGVAVRMAAAALVLLMVFSFAILPLELTFPLSRGADSMVLLTCACGALLLASGGRWSVAGIVGRALRGRSDQGDQGVRVTEPNSP